MLTRAKAKLTLAGLVILLIVCVLFSFRLKFDFEFESLYPHNDADLDFYQNFSAAFEPDDNYILVGIENKGSVFEKQFLQQVDAFTKAADSLPHVVQASSLTTITKPLFVAGIFTQPKLINLAAEDIAKDSAEIITDSRLKGRFVSTDAKALSVIITVSDSMSLSRAQLVNRELLSLIDNYDFEATHLAGKPYYQCQLVKRSQYEFVTYLIAIILITTIILTIIFRSFSRVLIALSSVLLGMVTFLGFLALVGKAIDPLATMLPILMIIVGMSDIIHLMSKYIDELDKGHSPLLSLKLTIREIGWATFLTSFTTAIGFSVLVTSNIRAMGEFGLTAAGGVIIAYIVIILYSASLFFLLPQRLFFKRKSHSMFWKNLLMWVFRITLKKQKAIAIVGICLIAVSLFGITKISTNTHFENYFPRIDKTRHDFHFFESAFGGVRNIELGIILHNDHTFDEPEVIEKIEALEQFLNDLGPFTSILSPATLYKTMQQAHSGGEASAYVLPATSREFDKVSRSISKIPKRTLETIMSNDKTRARITGRITDIGSDSTKALRKAIDDWAIENLDEKNIELRHTGSAYMLEKFSIYGRIGLFNGLGLAFIIISLLMALLFRNWRMVIISMIPNTIPLLVGAALMGYFGVELNASSAIIFAIAFGIAVDDTIHFLSKFKLEINKGKSVVNAIKNTFTESGKAIILTSLTLFFGFLILMTSSYPATFYIGFLVSLSLLSAMLADLFLLPVCIYLLLGKSDKPVVISWRKDGKDVTDGSTANIE